jgi:hypothetical protein
MRPIVLRLRTLLVLAFALFPGMAAAQSTISGVVTDTSGAVLPGVTSKHRVPRSSRRLES